MRKLFLVLPIALVACQSKFDSIQSTVGKSVDEVGCVTQESAMWDVLYASLETAEDVPSVEELSSLSQRAVQQKFSSEQDQQLIGQTYSDFYTQIGLEKLNSMTAQEKMEYLASLEIGNTTTPEAEAAQKRLERWRNSSGQGQMKAFAQNCPTPDIPIVDEPEANPVARIAWGARKVLATANQSCESARIAPLARSTPDLQGISIVGDHPDGVGRKRAISDLAALNRTNPYLKAYSPQSSCRDVRTNPLIYDYGGKPYASSSSTTLNLFKNSGSGTSVLGIDCSGYVFSSIATAGLRLAPNKALKPSLVSGVSSRMLMDPVKNGMSCLDKIKVGVSSSLKEGDVVSISGHTFVIESIGSDPFGFLTAARTAECDLITYEDFDFVVAQSSPSKGGVGINRYLAKDYLRENATIRQGLEDYARQGCKANFAKKDVLPVVTKLSVVRHKMTTSCISDAPIPLDGEACVAGCSF